MHSHSDFIVFADESGDHSLTNVSPQIRRQERPFVFLKSMEKRERFMADLTETLSRCPFVLISGVIHKTRLREQYVQPENPYSLALKYCMERTYEFLSDCGQQELETTLLVECRGKKEDAELELVFRRLCDGGSCWGRMPAFSIEFVDKRANLPGLQIADLVGMPIGQHVVRPESRNRAFEMIRRKFRRVPDDDVPGWGIKVFP